MDYKVIEKPPTPPDTPSCSEEDRTLVDVSPSSSSSSASSSPYLNGHSGYPVSHGVEGDGSPKLLNVYSAFSDMDNSKKRHSSSASPRKAPRGLTVDSSKRPSTPSSSSQAYPVPESLSDQIHYSSRAIAHRAKLFLGLASQTVINILPSTPLTAHPPSPSASQSTFPPLPTRHSPSRSPSPGPSNTSPTLSSTSRLLTGYGRNGNGKGKGRADDDEGPHPPAWLQIVQTLKTLVPMSSGPKRIRTKARRYLIFIACLSLLCYVFSNTLQEAYYSAAIVRRQHYLDVLEKERLGPHLTEFKKHPIEELMANAKKEWHDKVARQSKTADEAIEEYKRRYKRDPPYGFTEWFAYAKSVGSVLVDEYDSLMASLEPYWAIEAEEIRRRTFQIGMQPSFALVHVEEGQGKDGGGTFWDANEDEELIKYYGVERARGFERMVRPFVGRPGIVNMVFAVNELAEPRVLVPWEEKQVIEQALKENTTVNLRQLNTIPSKAKKFFPDPVWKGDGTTWDVFIRTCPPSSAVRKQLTSMTNQVVHLADVMRVAYNGTAPSVKSKRRGRKVSDTVNESDQVEVQINVKMPSKRTRSVHHDSEQRKPSPPAIHDGEQAINHRESDFLTPATEERPTRDVHLGTEGFQFMSNMTSLSHDQLCNDSRSHDMQGQFCSDFRSLDSLYPVFSPSTMPGFADIVVPSHYYAATGPKYHLEAHRKKVKKAVKDPKTGKWAQILVLEDFPAWSERRNKIFWRGSTTGGGNNPAGRQLNYQRHRFIRMTSDNSTDPVGVVLPPQNGTNDLSYVELPTQRVNEETMDAAFTSLDGCGHEKVCDAVRNGGYRIGDKVPLIDVTKYKMLIDIDGMAYSARLMALFESGAAVLKSTIYTEYFSDQIQPWYHFIPISSMYSEIYNVYSYFLGSPATEAAPQSLVDSSGKPINPKGKQKTIYEPHPHISAPNNEGAHETELQAIGERGQDWQMQFGKTRDMEVYVYRLALEWGRLWQKDGPVGTF